MKVMIKGVTPIGGIHQIAVGGRFFPTDSDGRLVDVLDQPEDPPQVMIPVVNSTTGAAVPTLRPDPDRMGRKSYEEILKDGRFQVIQTDVVDARASGAMVAAARAETQRLAGENADLKIAVAQLEAKLEDLARTLAVKDKALADLTDEHAGLMEQIEAETAPPQTKAEIKAQAKADAKEAKDAAAAEASGPHEGPK